MGIVEKELKRIKTTLLYGNLPIWEDYSLLQSHPLDERLDNHYFSVAYEKALLELVKLDPDRYEVTTIGSIITDIFTGLAPQDEGVTPLIEGPNMMPNVILPSFEKFHSLDEGEEKNIIQVNDILLSKDGYPGVVCAISDGLIKALREELEYEEVAVATHVYRIILKERVKKYAPFIGAFMNSKLGQALVRRYVSGSVTPTIRAIDATKIIVAVPKDDKLADRIRNTVSRLQQQAIAIAYSKSVTFSNDVITKMFGRSVELPKLPESWLSKKRLAMLHR